MSDPLATVRKIESIKPHPNADLLELAKLEGLAWQVVVKKDEFSPGDTCVYIQIDSVLPDKEEFAFLENKKFRIKTVRLRGEISQGICFPLDILPGGSFTRFVGDDVTELIGVTKYEKPVPVMSEAKGNFPVEFAKKTDETRIQNHPEMIDMIGEKGVYISLKMDGTSATFINDGGTLRVCSRNFELEEPEEGVANKYWDAARALTIPEGYTVQGELIGEGIQKNPVGIEGNLFMCFNVFKGGKKLKYEDFVRFCFTNNIEMVPLVHLGYFSWDSVDSILEFADQQVYPNGKAAEGIVVRLIEDEYYSKIDKEFSFKVISNEYALKHDE